MFGTIIELEAWGDYDMLYTDCIMVTEEVWTVSSLISSFVEDIGFKGDVDIRKDGINGLPYDMLSDFNSEFKKYLKKQGFRVLKTKKVHFSD